MKCEHPLVRHLVYRDGKLAKKHSRSYSVRLFFQQAIGFCMSFFGVQRFSERNRDFFDFGLLRIIERIRQSCSDHLLVTDCAKANLHRELRHSHHLVSKISCVVVSQIAFPLLIIRVLFATYRKQFALLLAVCTAKIKYKCPTTGCSEPKRISEMVIDSL